MRGPSPAASQSPSSGSTTSAAACPSANATGAAVPSKPAFTSVSSSRSALSHPCGTTRPTTVRIHACDSCRRLSRMLGGPSPATPGMARRCSWCCSLSAIARRSTSRRRRSAE